MAEDLIPKGDAYGSRQKNVANMRAAGLPTSSEHAAPLSPSATLGNGGAAPARPRPTRAGAAPTDDPLMALDPGVPIAAPITPAQVFQTIAERSVNPMMKLIAMRLAEDEGQ